MHADSFLSKCVGLLKKPGFRGKVLKVLYQLSLDGTGDRLMAETDPPLMPLMKELLFQCPRPSLPEELAALVVNLTWYQRHVEALCEKAGLRRLMDRLLKHQDPLVMKIIRNISQWTLNIQAHLPDPENGYHLR